MNTLRMMERLGLHDFHARLGASFAEVSGAEVVSCYGDFSREYRALKEGAAILDLTFRGRLCVTGSDRLRFLHGQVTNDVKGLHVGEGCYAALITAKARMQSDLNIHCLQDELLLDFEPGLTAEISERLEKYVIADDVQIVDVAPHYGLLSIQGPKAGSVVELLGFAVKPPANLFGSIKVEHSVFGEIYLINRPRTGTTGLDVFVPTAALEGVAEKLEATVADGAAGWCGWNAFETGRIEAGIPRFGTDMDNSIIPLEAGLESSAISFNKGCYIGQEIISRIKTYSEVSKTLRGLRLEGDWKTPPIKGDKLFQGEKEVGYITSATFSPEIKSTIALGYVRKEANQTGNELRLRSAGNEGVARIVDLPFKNA